MFTEETFDNRINFAKVGDKGLLIHIKLKKNWEAGKELN